MKKNILKIIIILAFITGMFIANKVSAEPIQPILSLYVNTDLTSASVPYNGSVQINWRPTNTNTCIATGGDKYWPGERKLAGNYITGPLTSSLVYSMTCSGGLGTTPVTKSVTVSIESSPSRRRAATATVTGNTDLSVYTDEASNVTYTTAVLQGLMEASSVPTLPITAYFRYSKADFPPIFCNDIYGTNMTSTKDIPLGIVSSTSFSQPISNLIPDTTYYYCAIISDKQNIIYGGSSVVRKFHTNPYQTTVRTGSATSIGLESAVLNGTVSSIDNVTTYFQYKEASKRFLKSPTRTLKFGDSHSK